MAFLTIIILESDGATMKRDVFTSPMDTDIRRIQGPEPRLTLDFMLDPSLFVSILHSLEVAYWTLPFGFLLIPILNIFRVPNRRAVRISDFLMNRRMEREYEEILEKSLEKYSHQNLE